ncbi:hypothetical protein MPSEU_000101500 [Mayamaea pseudoterrestris]|nr:hypothetical protein MPSEU_000101500 [Mayamaea pseudoterrestris]
MTILERRRRVQERSTSCKKPRELLLNHHPSRSTQFSVTSSQSKQKVSSLLQSLQYKNRRNRQMEKPRPDVIVMRAIRETVRELLREQPTISLHNMANALAANEYIFELYSMPLMDRDVYQTCQPNSGAYSMMQSLAASLKSKLSIFSNDTTSDRNEKQNSLDRKYQLTNAFSKLRNTTGSASTIMIRSWEDAKAHLATVFDLGSLGPETSEEPNESDRVVHKYDRALRDISRESLLEKPIGMTPSQLRFQEMAKLGQVPKAISEPLQQQIEAAYQKREELENARLDKLRAIEEETKRKEQEAEAKKRAAELMRQMTTQEQDLVKKALYGIGPNTEVIAKIGSDTCQRGSIQRLQPGEWLNDEVIHYFLIMLSLRDEQLVNEGKRSRRSHFFKSYFMTKLMNDGDSEKDGMYEYKNVKRWSKNVPGKFYLLAPFVLPPFASIITYRRPPSSRQARIYSILTKYSFL